MTLEVALVLLVLGFASFRITRFILWDSLIGTACDGQPFGNGLRNPDTSIGVAVSEFAFKPNGEAQGWFRGKLGELLQCSWCTGFWVSAALYFAWFNPAISELDLQDAIMIFAVAAVQVSLSSKPWAIPVEAA